MRIAQSAKDITGVRAFPLNVSGEYFKCYNLLSDQHR